jgi:alpha-L-rhamnosidase
MKKNFAILLAATLLLPVCSALAAADLANLRCEYLANPLGIDVTEPRLSWVIESTHRGERQTAYQILVASSEELLAKAQGDLWDSGKVVSDQSIQIKPRQQNLWVDSSGSGSRPKL